MATSWTFHILMGERQPLNRCENIINCTWKVVCGSMRDTLQVVWFLAISFVLIPRIVHAAKTFLFFIFLLSFLSYLISNPSVNPDNSIFRRCSQTNLHHYHSPKPASPIWICEKASKLVFLLSILPLWSIIHVEFRVTLWLYRC